MKKHNLRRFDLSDRLIHFVRPVDLLAENCPPAPEDEDYGFGNIVEDTNLSPLFVLRLIIRTGKILPTWSIRRGRRTVYGESPAICLTEMPLAAFLETSMQRADRGENVSSYGIVFDREQAFQHGARPVIYGESAEYGFPHSDRRVRRLDDAFLGPAEQYRYVAFNPTTSRGPDWSHEREWRIPIRECPAEEESYEGLIQHGLPLALFSNIGLVVANDTQLHRVLYDAITNIDTQRFAPTTLTFVLVRSRLPKDPAGLIGHEHQAEAIKDARIDLDSIMSIDEHEALALETEFDDIVSAAWQAAPGFHESEGEAGGCWLWLKDNTTRLVRALVARKRIVFNDHGRYLVPMPVYPDYLGLRHREDMTKKIAAVIEEQFGTEATYYSVLGSDDPSGLPFYIGQPFGGVFPNHCLDDSTE